MRESRKTEAAKILVPKEESSIFGLMGLKLGSMALTSAGRQRAMSPTKVMKPTPNPVLMK